MNYTYDKLVGQRISQLRQQRHLTQEELCAKLQVAGYDIARTSLAKIELGHRHIYAYELKAFSEIFSISCDELLNLIIAK